MQRARTTVVAVIGAADGQLEAAASTNVGIASTDADLEPLQRAVDAQQLVAHTSRPFVLHDADPLALVAEQWLGQFEGSAPVGALDVARHETLQRWRAGSIDLPDYYLVVTSDEHDRSSLIDEWYLGFLAAAAAQRVVPHPTDRPLWASLPTLPAGRWWPAMDRLLGRLGEVMPGRVVVADDDDRTQLLAPGSPESVDR